MSDKVAETLTYSITASLYFNESVHKSMKNICKSTLTDNTYLLESSKSFHESTSPKDSFRFNEHKLTFLNERNNNKEITNVK